MWNRQTSDCRGPELISPRSANQQSFFLSRRHNSAAAIPSTQKPSKVDSDLWQWLIDHDHVAASYTHHSTAECCPIGQNLDGCSGIISFVVKICRWWAGVVHYPDTHFAAYSLLSLDPLELESIRIPGGRRGRSQGLRCKFPLVKFLLSVVLVITSKSDSSKTCHHRTNNDCLWKTLIGLMLVCIHKFSIFWRRKALRSLHQFKVKHLNQFWLDVMWLDVLAQEPERHWPLVFQPWRD